MATSVAAREFDLVVLGASGSVGNVLTRYLVENAPMTTKWAIAGRASPPSTSRGTTAALLDKMRAEEAASPGRGRSNLPSLIACDVRDEASVLAMARRTRIVGART